MSTTAFAELVAPAAWRTVDFISDLHLQAGEAATFEAWRAYLQSTQADAIFILGDLFEVWIGDDAAAPPGFESQCAALLHEAATQRPVFFMHGNRDFLVGDAAAAQCGFTLLDDPTLLVLRGEHWLLSHGDALCLADTDYLRFRAQVRTPQWRDAFLARPLDERRAMARAMRTQSEDRKQRPDKVWADVDTGAACDWLRRADARTLIHGHTHKPREHDLGHGMTRIVLSDWDASARPPRAQVLRIGASGVRRVDLL